MPKIDVDWMSDVLEHLLRIPSPSGRTDAVMQRIGDVLTDLGVPFDLTRRGALRAVWCGDQEGPDRAIVVHADTTGAMVTGIRDNGRLAVTPIGTWSARFAEGGRVIILTDDPDQTFTGTVLPLLASGHAFGHGIDEQGIGWDQVEVRVDEPVHTPEDTAALGIQVGDFVAFDADPVITSGGYVKSRHLDGKAGVAAALAAFKALVDDDVVLEVPAHLLVTIAEEVGQGASHGLAADVAEMVSVDNGVIAPGQHTAERGVTVALLDQTGPFDFHLTRRLLAIAADHDIPVARDTFRHYRSDVAAALEAGTETRAALVAFGLDASHGHERVHLDSVVAVAELVVAYLLSDLTFPRWDAAAPGPLGAFPSSAQPAPDEPETGRD